MGLFSGIGKALFGSSPKTKTIKAEDRIAPESDSEKARREGLDKLHSNIFGWATGMGTSANDMFKNNSSNYSWLNNSMMNGLSDFGDLQKWTINTQKDLANGKLSDEWTKNYDDYVGRQANNQLGSVLNGLANDGTISSSSFDKNFRSISDSATDALAKNRLSAIQTAITASNNPLNSLLSSSSNLSSLAEGQLKQPLSIFDMINQMQAYPVNMYNNQNYSRHGVTDQTYQTGGSSGLLGTALGIGLGKGLTNPIGDWTSNWFKSPTNTKVGG